MRPTAQISHLGPREVGPFKGTAEDTADIFANLERFGIGLDSRHVEAMFQAYKAGAPMLGMDADLTAPITTPSINTPIQFLQAWLPGFTFVLTQARKIDDLIGVTTMGRWEDEEVVQGILERTGNTTVYGDTTNVPLSSWNVNFEPRTIVRFEEGLAVGRLEEARAAAMRVSSAESKRSAAAEALEITRNFTGFFGYNGGANRTYGFLNDPALPAAAGVAAAWSTATFQEIISDLRGWFAALRTQSGGRVDPGSDPITIALALSVFDQLSVTTDFGISAREWVNKTYPNVRIIGAPELDNGINGTNGAIIYAEGVSDDSTDDGRTWVQVVPSKFQTLGVQQEAKRYIEDYSNASAGVFLKRPYAVYVANDL